jgi:hypothetical protein
MIVGSDNKIVESESKIATFSFCTVISPGIHPALKLIDERFTRLKSEIIKNDGLMTLVAAPPLIIFLKISVRVFFPDGSGFACSSLSIMPLNILRVGARRDFYMILLDFTDVSVVSKKNI